MKLTPELKARIDSLSVFDLLERVRRAPIGDPTFQGEVGEYWLKRLAEKRSEDNAAYVAASKAIG